MASMTDIVFLLLIFFMIASTLVTSSALDLQLPSSKVQTVKRQDVTVNIAPDLRISVGKDIVSESELEGAILAQAKNDPEAVVMLRADKSVPYEKVVMVMDIAYRNKLKMIAATNPK